MAVLEVLNLSKSFATPEGRRHVVIDVPRFVMDEGAQAALEGDSGSGKTTFLNLIAGILAADAGRVVVAGHDITACSESRRDRVRARSIGYIFQTFNLLQGYTAFENVELGMSFGPGGDRAWARHLLERVGLKDRMSYMPRQLSVGQQQRVAVARALANRPALVLADEPTGNLDHRQAQAALELIRQVCRENRAALLMVSHARDVITQFPRVEKLAEINKAATDADESDSPTDAQGVPA
jgi:putative ABC transport system ATP-binding protein